MNINQELKVNIKAHISKKNELEFARDLGKIEQREYLKLKDAKYMIVQLFLQLGTPEHEDVQILDYRNREDIWLYIKAKIKSYTIFKSEANYLKYKNEELDKNDLYLNFKVENGKIKGMVEQDSALDDLDDSFDKLKEVTDKMVIEEQVKESLNSFVEQISSVKIKMNNSLGV